MGTFPKPTNNIMAIVLKLYKHKDSENKEIDGKWFAKTKKMQEVNLNEIARLLARRTGMTRGTALTVLIDVVDVMKEQMANGRTVVLGDLGRFSYSVRSSLVDRPEDFDPCRHIKRILCRFLPVGKRDPETRRMHYPLLEGLDFVVVDRLFENEEK